MAAPSLAALYDFESQFERAAQDVLEGSGIAGFITAQGEKLPTINTGVSFETGPALDQLTFLPLASGQVPPAYQEYFRYTGNLDLEVSVNRDTVRQPTDTGVTTFLGEVRGRIRSTFLKSIWPFDDSNLPYLRVSDIRPNGTTIGFNQALNVDTQVLRFVITFAIQPSAWPVGFPLT
jgi:hypothetical protein